MKLILILALIGLFFLSACDSSTYGDDESASYANSNVKYISIIPQPTNSWATVSFFVNDSGRADLKLENMTGKTILKVFDKVVAGGSFRVNIDMRKYNDGIYVVHLEAPPDISERAFIVKKGK